MLSDYTKMQLYSYIQNILKFIIQKIYITKDIKIIKDGKPTSVYLRYLLLYCLMLIKISILKKMVSWFCNYIDIESDTLQIVQNINYVDRYIIYENDDKKNIIQNTMKYIENNKKNMKEITIPNCLIIKCYMKDDGKKETDLKELFKKYATEKIQNHTIENIFKYNEIEYNEKTNVYITKIKFGKIYNVKYNITNFLKKTIFELYENNQ
jgi:hypothetical protein